MLVLSVTDGSRSTTDQTRIVRKRHSRWSKDASNRCVSPA